MLCICHGILYHTILLTVYYAMLCTITVLFCEGDSTHPRSFYILVSGEALLINSNDNNSNNDNNNSNDDIAIITLLSIILLIRC